MAAIGPRAPSVHLIQCVRADCASGALQGLQRPLVQLPAFRGRKPMAAWLTDEQLATFVVTTDGRPPLRQDLKQLAMLHVNDEALTARDSQIEASHRCCLESMPFPGCLVSSLFLGISYGQKRCIETNCWAQTHTIHGIHRPV